MRNIRIIHKKYEHQTEVKIYSDELLLQYKAIAHLGA